MRFGMDVSPALSESPPSADAVSRAPFGRALDNVKLVTELLYHSAREDEDAIAPLLHEDFKVVSIPGIAPARGYQSRTEFLAFFGESRRTGQVVRPDVRSIEVLPNGAVLVQGRLLLVAGDMRHEMNSWFVYTFGDGVICSLGNYVDAESARRAALLGQPA